jgi:hypothetical protein
MSLRLKLTIIFLAVTLIPVLFISAITFNNYKNSLESSRLSSLRDIATLKSDKIEQYFEGLKVCMELVQNSYAVRTSLTVLS